MIRKYDFDYSVINKNGFTNYGVASRIAHDPDEKKDDNEIKRKEKITRVMELINAKEKKENIVTSRFWHQLPIRKIIYKENLKLTCFLTIIGSGWIELSNDVCEHYSNVIIGENDELLFDKGNWFEKMATHKTADWIWSNLF
jgi:hypothetical protein